MANEYRASWHGLEAFHSGNANIRVSFHAAEAFHSGNAQARSSWHGVEVFRSIASTAGGESGYCSIIWG